MRKGEQVDDSLEYEITKCKFEENPMKPMHQDERYRRFTFEQLEKARAEQMISWADKDVYGNKKQAFIH